MINDTAALWRVACSPSLKRRVHIQVDLIRSFLSRGRGRKVILLAVPMSVGIEQSSDTPRSLAMEGAQKFERPFLKLLEARIATRRDHLVQLLSSRCQRQELLAPVRAAGETLGCHLTSCGAKLLQAITSLQVAALRHKSFFVLSEILHILRIHPKSLLPLQH